jgi:hypothetical protein
LNYDMSHHHQHHSQADKAVPPNPRLERRVILSVVIIASAACFSLVLVNLGGGVHFVETHPPTSTPTPSVRVRPAATPADDSTDAAAGSSRGETAVEGAPNDDRATLVVMSYPGSKRHHRLVEILRRMLLEQYDADGYSRAIAEGVLVWNGREAEIPASVRVALGAIAAAAPVSAALGGDPSLPLRSDSAFEKILVYGSRLRVLIARANSVDNRWRLGAFLRTATVLNLDDDINLYPEGAACLMSVRHSLLGPHVLVAADVRSHCVHGQQSCKDHKYDGAGNVVGGPPAGHGPYGYAARHIVNRVKHYSIALPRALVVSRATLLEYDRIWLDKRSGLRSIVKELECDDLALNYVAANASLRDGPGNLPTAVLAKARYVAYSESHSGMFDTPGMKDKRQKCVNRLAALFANGRAGASVAKEDALEDGLTIGQGAPRFRSWFVHCSVDG